jgi:hypothetical protein
MDKRVLLGLALGWLVGTAAAPAQTNVSFNAWLDLHPGVGVVIYQNPAVLRDRHWMYLHPDVAWWVHRQPSLAYWRPSHSWHHVYGHPHVPPGHVYGHGQEHGWSGHDNHGWGGHDHQHGNGDHGHHGH